MGSICRVETLDTEMIHFLAGMELEGTMFHHAVRMACNLKVINCLYLEPSVYYFQSIDWPWVTETMGKGGQQYRQISRRTSAYLEQILPLCPFSPWTCNFCSFRNALLIKIMCLEPTILKNKMIYFSAKRKENLKQLFSYLFIYLFSYCGREEKPAISETP